MKNFTIFCTLFFIFESLHLNGQNVTVYQASAPVIMPGTTNNPILKIEIETSAPSTTITDPTINTNGSTSPVTDINNAKLWYSGNDSVFDLTTAQLLNTHLSPGLTNTTFNISITLGAGFHYLWLTYDVLIGATICNYLDGEFVSMIIGGMPFLVQNPSPPGYGVIGVCTSIPDNSDIFSNVTVSPNPASEFVLLKGISTTHEQLSVQLFDVLGRKVADCYNEKPGIGEFEIQIPLNEISPGMYSMVLLSGKSTRIFKLMKQ